MPSRPPYAYGTRREAMTRYEDYFGDAELAAETIDNMLRAVLWYCGTAIAYQVLREGFAYPEGSPISEENIKAWLEMETE